MLPVHRGEEGGTPSDAGEASEFRSEQPFMRGESTTDHPRTTRGRPRRKGKDRNFCGVVNSTSPGCPLLPPQTLLFAHPHRAESAAMPSARLTHSVAGRIRRSPGPNRSYRAAASTIMPINADKVRTRPGDDASDCPSPATSCSHHQPTRTSPNATGARCPI